MYLKYGRLSRMIEKFIEYYEVIETALTKDVTDKEKGMQRIELQKSLLSAVLGLGKKFDDHVKVD